MTAYDVQRERLLDLVATAPNQRIRPSELSQKLAQEIGSSTFVANELIKHTVAEGDLVYAYRDPCSYVEIPCNGCEGGHRAARPMRVFADSKGNPWLCDDDVTDAEGLGGTSCWNCGEVAFTRS